MQEQKDKKNLIEQGFTLIELLVVIAILGILAAVVVFSVNGIVDRGNKSACQTEVSTIQTAVEAYNAQNNAYPAAAATATAADTVATLNSEIGKASGVGHKFLNTDLVATQPGESPSILAGFRYTTAGDYSGGTC